MVDFSTVSTEGVHSHLESSYKPFKMLPPLSKEKMCPNNSGIEEDQAESVDSGCVPDIGISPETNWTQVSMALDDEYGFAFSLLQHTFVNEKAETLAKAPAKTHTKLEIKEEKKSKKKRKASSSSSKLQEESSRAAKKTNKKQTPCIETNEEIASSSKQTNENRSKPIKNSKKLQDRSISKSNLKNKIQTTSEGLNTKKGRGKAPKEIEDFEDLDKEKKKELTTLQRELGQELGRLKKGKSGNLTPSQMRHCESKLRKKLKVLEKKRKHEEKKKKKTAIELPEKTEQAKKIYNNCGKLVFSKFDFSHPVQSKYTDPKPKTDLNRALNSVLKEKEKIKHLQSTGKVEEAADYMKNIAWTNAVKKVSGQKVKDDIVRLKKAVHRKKLQKFKSKEKWEERNRSTQKSKDLRQEKRKRNIETRKQNKKQGKGKGKGKGKGRVPGF